MLRVYAPIEGRFPRNSIAGEDFKGLICLSLGLVKKP